MSPARPQDPAFTAHLLVLTNLRLTFFPKLFMPTFPLTQANETRTPPPPAGGGKDPDKNLPPRPFEPNLTRACADGPWSDLWKDLESPLPRY